MLYHYHYFESLQPMKTINIQEREFYTSLGRIISQSRQTDEKMKIHTDKKDVEKTLLGC